MTLEDMVAAKVHEVLLEWAREVIYKAAQVADEVDKLTGRNDAMSLAPLYAIRDQLAERDPEKQLPWVKEAIAVRVETVLTGLVRTHFEPSCLKQRFWMRQGD